MKKKIFFSLLGVMLLLIPGALWAGNQNDMPQDTPAILVSLGQSSAIPLDDATAAAVRGQAQYVLVKVIGLNTFDFGPGVHWTFNPFGYRYGNWGGPNWSGQEGGPVDSMDGLFKDHDLGASDLWLLGGLAALANDSDPFNYWGNIYFSTPGGAPSKVYVYGFSLIGGRIFTRPVPMAYSEYSRREAVYGMQLLILGKSILRIN
ncbi:MAG: hypothetical protein HY787_15800 [Deltaproteobacteria bacterium]|nr:hypothetical protein [Deltaproteobacteria bacterium]